jgi:hypothetical protein
MKRCAFPREPLSASGPALIHAAAGTVLSRAPAAGTATAGTATAGTATAGTVLSRAPAAGTATAGTATVSTGWQNIFRASPSARALPRPAA